MKTILGYLVERDNRSLFIRNINEAAWAMEDSEYTVTPLVPLPSTEFYEQFVVEVPAQTDDTQERIQLMNELFELQEVEISQLKHSLEEAVELVESIHEFASKQTQNIMESRGLLLLIAEACNKWLAPKERH